jgi:hypothetical protein
MAQNARFGLPPVAISATIEPMRSSKKYTNLIAMPLFQVIAQSKLHIQMGRDQERSCRLSTQSTLFCKANLRSAASAPPFSKGKSTRISWSAAPVTSCSR